MNFFAHQELARRQTRRMLVLFVLAVLALVAATDFVLLFAVGGVRALAIGPVGLGILSLCVLLAIGLASLYRIATLRSGGAAVAQGLGAVPVPADTTQFAYRRLRNVVEELAIASGVPVPDVFVLEEEAGINAFASGYAPSDAAITVTRGALDKLTREELQGVIGHEFSHVLNGDMRLNIRLMGVVFGILVMAVVGRRIARAADRGRGRSAGGLVVLGFGLLAVGYVGVILARLIKASISRQREFLADASAVQFTRQTEGIGGALKKIGALAEGSRLAASEAEEVSHMLFSNGFSRSPLFATHPPLDARILKLDPAFRPEQLKAIAAAWSEPVPAADPEAAGVSIAGFAPLRTAAAGGRAIPAATATMRLSPASVARQVGNPGVDDQVVARHLHASIPAPLRDAATQPAEAMPLVFALLLSPHAEVRARQLGHVAERFGDAMAVSTAGLAGRLVGLHPMQRLPLAALAFPVLRRRPRPQLAGFMDTVADLIGADRRTTLDEHCLATLLRVQVMEALDPAAARPAGRERLPRVERELRDLLAILARHGHEDAEAARRAYALGLREVLPGATLDYRPPVDWPQALDRALARLDLLMPAGKELVVQAMTVAISSDGVMSVAEAELLRTVCAALHCPLPPLLEDAS